MERLVEVEKLTFDSGVELSLRPDIWEEYIGQEKIKRNLRVYIDAALKRQDVLDHVLFMVLLDLVKQQSLILLLHKCKQI